MIKQQFLSVIFLVGLCGAAASGNLFASMVGMGILLAYGHLWEVIR